MIPDLITLEGAIDLHCHPYPDLFPRWLDEPDCGRVATGVKNRVPRLKALGNAVVPQVVEQIGRAILAAEEGE